MNREYFARYCGRGPYDLHYRDHSGIDHCIATVERLGLRVRSVLVLGAATGRVLEDFERAWGLRPYGCERSAWAHARIPPRLRRRVARADMRGYVRRLARAGRRFDLLFSSAPIYLPARQVGPFLGGCSRVADHFHFWSSTAEDFEPGDRWRVTLRPRRWWRAVFVAAGYRPTRSPYLWRSRGPAPLS